ncbi:MAG TPA: hypothetical protein VGS22_05025 [Thermoanaerobaculia bacterium]|jgi:hypothetical protein|nr:hypothetical protein [Thermoanaerobaculia bacterium]
MCRGELFFRIQRLLLLQGGGTERTNTPDRLPQKSWDRMLFAASLGAEEQGLLASFIDELHWCLLTSERLIWRNDPTLGSLYWSEIEEFDDGRQEVTVGGGWGDRMPLPAEPGRGRALIQSALHELWADGMAKAA